MNSQPSSRGLFFSHRPDHWARARRVPGAPALEGDIETAYSCLGGAQTTDQFATDALLVKAPEFNPASGTFAHPLQANSPAIDAGNPQVSDADPAGASCPGKDQFGATRPVDGNGDGEARCDIGTVEASAAPPAVPPAPPGEEPPPPEA